MHWLIVYVISFKRVLISIYNFQSLAKIKRLHLSEFDKKKELTMKITTATASKQNTDVINH